MNKDGYHWWSKNCLTLWSIPVFSVGRVVQSFVYSVVCCRSLFVLLSLLFWPLYCLVFFDLRLLITSLWFTASDYLPLIYDFWLPPFDLRLLITSLLIYGFWLPPFVLRLLITSLWFTASDYHPLIYGFWLPLLYLRFTASDYLFCIFKLVLYTEDMKSQTWWTKTKYKGYTL